MKELSQSRRRFLKAVGSNDRWGFAFVQQVRC
jgi:hypothetical protein